MTKLDAIVKFEKIRDEYMRASDICLIREFRKLIGQIFDEFNYPESKKEDIGNEEQRPEMELRS